MCARARRELGALNTQDKTRTNLLSIYAASLSLDVIVS